METSAPEADAAEAGHSTCSSTFSSSLSKFAYQSPSPSPLKRKSTSSAASPTPTTKRLTRASSSQIFPTASSNASPARSPSSRSPKPNKKRRPTTPADSPSVNLLTDSLAPNLVLVLVGVNPGNLTAQTGHAYAHPSNLFWKLLYASGLTTRRCLAAEDHDMPNLFSLGLTNIVTRPTRDASMLKRDEMEAGVAVIEEKIRKWRPEAVCLVGKSIWESVAKVWRGRKLSRDEFVYGWQEERMGALEGEWEGARVFVATTSSGLAAGMSYAEKLDIWKELGTWVQGRRMKRKVMEDEGATGRESVAQAGASPLHEAVHSAS